VPKRRSKADANASSGRGCGLLFGVGWTLFSLLFVGIGVKTFWDRARVGGWDQVPCEILSFEIVDEADEDDPFAAEVRYRYVAEGRRVGTVLRGDDDRWEDYESLASLRRRLLDDPEPQCRVNPADPSEAVLVADREGLWGGLFFAVFGGGFTLVGIGMTIAMWRQKRARRARSAAADDETELGGVVAVGFFGVFAVGGLAMLLGFIGPRALDWVAMRGWVETPAEVIWSRVRSHSGDDGTTYSVDIFYRYEFDGEEHRSNRWSVIGGSSSGRGAKREVVAAHPPGTALSCWVDPEEPWRAVVKRGIGWWGLMILFPLPFLAVGFGGLWYTFFRRGGKEAGARGAKARRVDERGGRGALGVGSIDQAPRGAVERRPRSGLGKRWARFGGVLFGALFWNGITGVFVGIAWKSWQRGEVEWFLTLFMIPFVLIGAALILSIPYAFLAIFSPLYALSLPGQSLAPGERGRLNWRRTGGGGRPRRLRLWLVGEEKASYRRGTDRVTATSVFHEELLFETDRPQLMPSGSCDLPIPSEGVPSFHGEHNEIRWLVRLRAEVPWRPDVHDEHEIEVGT